MMRFMINKFIPLVSVMTYDYIKFLFLGNVSVNELLSRLVDAVDVWSGHQRVEVREEEERAARELVKWEQDQAYRESLEADRSVYLSINYINLFMSFFH